METKRNSFWTFLVAFILMSIFVVYLFAYQVPAGKVGVLIRLGDIKTPIDETPGLKFRLPWPFDEVRLLDMRTRLFSTKLQECLTKDKRNLNFKITAGWRIVDPNTFINRLKTVEEAEKSLVSRVDSARGRAVGEVELHDLINEDFNLQQEKFAAFEDKIKETLNLELKQADWGVTIDFLTVQQIGFPQPTTNDVFKRMIAERSEESKKIISEGESEGESIVSKAEAEKRSQLALADAKARIIRGEGDAAAAKHYTIFRQNPELANYLRSIQTLRKVMTERTTLLLTTKQTPFDLLEQDAVPEVKINPGQ
ncbi:MAG: hypothetical protein JXA52_03115 [Planctomycetes bacterium]|nr:hypothetical protein [Planctomycetota bacterium]